MSMHVPAETAIRSRSIRNVDDDRLLRRLDYLRGLLATWNRNPALGGRDSRISFAFRVVEAANIESELDRRAVPFEYVTQHPDRTST